MNPVATVYIVDDDAICRDMVEFAVRTGGFETRSFDCAESFLKEFDARHCACVLVDMNMPGMSGYDLQLRLMEIGADVPLLFVTAEADVTTAKAVLMNGAEDQIQKPIEPAELLQKIHLAIDRHREKQKKGRALSLLWSKLGSVFRPRREVVR